MHPIDDRCDTSGLYGRYRVRETVPAKEEDADVAIFEKRCDMSEGRSTVSDVSRR